MLFTTALCTKRKYIPENFTVNKQASCIINGDWVVSPPSSSRIKTAWDQGRPEHEECECKVVC